MEGKLDGVVSTESQIKLARPRTDPIRNSRNSHAVKKGEYVKYSACVVLKVSL